ncbi:MAG: hypothetical protein NDJ92_10430 [Thermoanaerobaculia bacterium]|nr:hypothetical protein [Thermoanaerobaculia bacterium]
MRFLIVAAVLLGSPVESTAVSDPTSAVIAELVSEAAQFHSQHRKPVPGRLVIANETIRPCAECRGENSTGIDESGNHIPKRLDHRAWTEFRRLADTAMFKDLFADQASKRIDATRVPSGALLVSSSAVELWPEGYPDCERIYQRFPRAAGAVRLSSVGISSDGMEAVIYAEITMVCSVSRRFYHLSNATGASWKVDWVAPVWFMPGC